MQNHCSEESFDEQPPAVEEEDIWQNLDLFNQSHSGRLQRGPELDAEISMRNATINGDDVVNDNDANSELIIPEHPEGQRLQFELKSTWGDPFYVGLNGLEVFNIHGEKAAISDVQVRHCSTAAPVPNCMKVANLFDNYYTHDLARLWLAPFNKDQPTIIEIQFEKPQTLALIKIWNYNKSRVHVSRGVRNLRIKLDDQIIFHGEIAAADSSQSAYEAVLFTSDEQVLQLIKNHEESFNLAVSDDEEDVDDLIKAARIAPAISRPGTAGDSLQGANSTSQSALNTLEEHQEQSNSLTIHGDNDNTELEDYVQIMLVLKQNYGLPGLIGLAGLQLRDTNQFVVPFTISVKDQDQNDEIMGVEDGPEDIDRLIDGVNLTTQSTNQCTIPFDGQTPVTLCLQVEGSVQLNTLQVWNYNTSLEMSYAGVRLIDIYVENELIAGNVLLRKAPGHLFYDFVQDVQLSEPLPINDDTENNTSNELLTVVYQIQLLSTWGDDFYVGLNGIELFDADQNKIRLQLHNLAAYPESVNVLRHVSEDPRTSAKLIDGVNDTLEAQHMWLTPLLRNDPNRIFIVFDKPTAVNHLRIWNYRKTEARGARDLIVLVDDIMIFSGELPMSSATQTAYVDVHMT